MVSVVINILLILNPKHSTVPATRKKVNSIPAETRTHAKWQQPDLEMQRRGK